MSSWEVIAGTKKGGPFTRRQLEQLAEANRLSVDAFIRLVESEDDWKQVAAVDWLVPQPEPAESRYCLECDARVIVSQVPREKASRCPNCSAAGQLVNFAQTVLHHLAWLSLSLGAASMSSSMQLLAWLSPPESWQPSHSSFRPCWPCSSHSSCWQVAGASSRSLLSTEVDARNTFDTSRVLKASFIGGPKLYRPSEPNSSPSNATWPAHETT